MISSYNPDIFQRIYQDVLEIKQELQSTEFVEHEWVDIDSFPSNDHQIKKENRK